MDYQTLRAQYPVFQYRGYEAKEDEQTLFIRYSFAILDSKNEEFALFTPEWTFPKKTAEAVLSDNATLARLIDGLGLTELVSYWKLTMSPKVELVGTALDIETARFLKKNYYHGLGEFFYVNHIDIDEDSFMHLHSRGAEPAGSEKPLFTSDLHMVPIGGGKDSAVSLEILRSLRDKCYAYAINPRGAVEETVKAAGLEARFIRAKRTLSPRMLELNRQGFLNGHTPFSMIVAFSSVIAAYLFGIGDIVLSNEGSANESTVAGSKINHQYSKSLEFEADFRALCARKLRAGVQYFSLLRPLSEYQIAWYFAGLFKYHGIFKSCNRGSKTDSWCGACPKCLFVYLILSPFIKEETLIRIFGHRLLDDEDMLSDFRKLTGIEPEKPFECVGERNEVCAAVKKAIENKQKAGEPLPFLFAHFLEEGMDIKNPATEHDFLYKIHSDHFVKDPYWTLLQKEMKLP